MHATVATPPCWGDAARLPSRVFHAVLVSVGAAVLSSAFCRPNVDPSIAAAAVLILSCSCLSLCPLLTDAQLRTPPPPLCQPRASRPPPSPLAILSYYVIRTFGVYPRARTTGVFFGGQSAEHLRHMVQDFCVDMNTRAYGRARGLHGLLCRLKVDNIYGGFMYTIKFLKRRTDHK